MTSLQGVKAEPGQHAINGQEPLIKQDPDSVRVSPAVQSEEDIYEDAGDLEFAGAAQGLYLTRVPKFLWESWSKLDDDQEIQIGTIRVEGSPGDMKRMSLLLSPDAAAKGDFPKEYNMHVMNQESSNTFVFTEKDLPGYRQYSHDRAPPRFKDRKKIEKNRRSEANFRRAIPKQTGLAGQVRTEINCLPVENAQYQAVMERRTLHARKPRKEIQILSDLIGGGGGNVLNPGILGTGDFANFTRQNVPSKAKKQELKAARIPQNELLDLILDCFKRYTYWPLKSLKMELNQPEAYLKETLDKVAVLIKTGPHTMTYQLRPEAREAQYQEAGVYDNAKEETAPDTGFDGNAETGGIKDDDENIKMEDVLTG